MTAVATMPGTVSRRNGKNSCSLELNTHENCRNISYKQTSLAKISQCSNVNPESGLFVWLK